MTNGGQRPDASGFHIENEMDLLFGRAHPNPTREGCPPADLLTRLAHRELPIGDPAYDHIGKCSPCYQELRAIQQADAKRLAATVRRKRLAYAAAAVLVLAILGSWFVMRETGSLGGRTDASIAQVEQDVLLDLRPFAVTRGPEPAKEPDALVLPRARLRATILLEVGSEPGDYEIQIRDANQQPRANATSRATIVDFVTTLKTSLDTSILPPGSYQLAVRRDGEDWRLVPVQLR
jgi:hypothetical protein